MKNIIIIIVLCFSCLGCSGKPEGLGGLVPCKLILTQEGSPAEGVAVVLSTGKIDDPWYICGTSDSTGLVEFKTQGKYDGVPAGTYKVVLRKMETRTGKDLLDKKVVTLIEKSYLTAKTTPLSLVVENAPVEQIMDIGKKVQETLE